MAMYIEIKSLNPKLRQDQIAKELGCKSSTLKRHRNDINMLSFYRNPPNSHKRRQKTSIEDINRPEKTSIDLKGPELTSKKSFPVIETFRTNISKKNKLKMDP